MRKIISKGLQYSIKVHLSTAFVLTLLAFGVLLGWFHYQKLTDLLVASSEQLSDRIADEVISDFNISHSATANIVELLALSPLMESTSLNERFSHLPSLALALDTHKDVAALEVGYENGDYFIVRKINSAVMRKRFSAPEDASYIVDNIETLGEDRFLERFFFDSQLLQLDYQSMGNSEYDPRVRPWFKLALENDSVSTTAPYFFYFFGQVGVTVVKASEFKQHVFGADITLSALNESLRANPASPSSEMLIVTDDGFVVASRRDYRTKSAENSSELIALSEVTEPAVQDYLVWKESLLEAVAEDGEAEERAWDLSQAFTSRGESWLAVVKPVSLPGMNANLLVLTPERELLQEAYTIRNQSVMITSLIVLLSIPLALVIAHYIAEPLRMLAAETQRINRFDYSSGIKLKSMIREIHELAAGMDIMKQTIARFTDLIRSVSAEKDFVPLLTRVTSETMHVSQADGALIYLMNDEGTALEPRSLQNREGVQEIGEIPSLMLSQEKHPFIMGASSSRVRVIKVNNELHGDDPTCRYLRELLNTSEADIVLVPLRNRQEQKIGLLCLLFDSRFEEGQIITEDARIAFVNALSGFSAITIESRYLLKAQKELLESFMKLMAGAIDEKSPYTGGHCQRVPELTKMLARAACTTTKGPFARFNMNAEQWEELHIAAWMHDCGKVTTPEYVVDKATKLETIYDRIHEIRMRFEVIKQTEAVQTWKSIAEGGNKEAALLRLEQLWQEIDDDWKFVAACNKGSEGLSEADAERLRQIADRTWTRTLDDRLGISWEEAKRRQDLPEEALPTSEKLLDNKPYHVIPWQSGERLSEDNPWEFKMDVPVVKYDRGELHNLLVQRGTLTDEERFIINNHIVQTIIMLKSLPFPRHLQHVPEIAGGHHEKMDGTGYPRRLSRDEMPVTARMMAIADIFEALTASDRPYKEPKTLSESLEIMNRMRHGQHIDPEVFELFLRSGVYLEYARRFLTPDQIDAVDIDALLEAETSA